MHAYSGPWLGCGWGYVGDWRAAFIDRPGQQLFPLADTPEIIEPDLLKIAKKLIVYN